MNHQPLPDSDRSFLLGTKVIGPAHPEERLQVTVVTKGHFAASTNILSFAHLYNLAVVERDDKKKTVKLSGTVAEMTQAFGVNLHNCTAGKVAYRGREGKVHLPAGLHSVVDAVLGLDNRPAARSRARKRKEGFRGTSYEGRRGVVTVRNASDGSLPIPDICQLYNFPKVDASRGVYAIGLIELGGGYSPQDISTYWAELTAKYPQFAGLEPIVTPVSVDGATNSPGSDADGEVMLDILVAAAAYSCSTGQKAKIVVYFAPNTDAGYLNAVNALIHDSVNKPVAGSTSWGSEEKSWTTQARLALANAIASGAPLGVTITAAAGDNGSSDGGSGNNVDFPGSAPATLCVGGTRLVGANGVITSETVWNDGAQGGATGGGVSTAFYLPAYQKGLSNLKMRGVPDVAANADPETGYQVRVDGQDTVIGGTSAAAPLWAALIAVLNTALLNAGKPPIGDPHVWLYGLPAGVLNDVTVGNNNAYKAGPGWDACTGLGTPNGVKLLASLGIGQTPTPTAPVQPPASVTLTLSGPLAAGNYTLTQSAVQKASSGQFALLRDGNASLKKIAEATAQSTGDAGEMVTGVSFDPVTCTLNVRTRVVALQGSTPTTGKPPAKPAPAYAGFDGVDAGTTVLD